MTATATKTRFTITSGRNNARLYAVITTDTGDNASIFTDGSVRINWQSGRVNDVTPPAGHVAKPDEDAEKIVQVFTAADAVSEVHIAPTSFTSQDASDLWFQSIGLEIEPHQNRVM